MYVVRSQFSSNLMLCDFKWPLASSCDLLWLHVTSCDLMWLHVTSCDFMWAPVTSFDFMWLHVTSCDLMWPHVTSCALYSSQTWSGPRTSCSPPPSARWRGRPTTGSLSVGDFSSGFSLNSDKFWSDWKLYTLYFGFHYPTSTQCQVVCWFDPLPSPPHSNVIVTKTWMCCRRWRQQPGEGRSRCSGSL